MSGLEDLLLFQVGAARLPLPETQYKFHPDRKWKADFCWVNERLIVEVDGGTWTGGRHTTGQGFERDCEKLNAAALLGYRVLRFTGAMVKDGRALLDLQEALK